MKSIRLRYFASLREKTGKDTEMRESAARTYGDLYSELQKEYGFPLPLDMIQVAVDDEFSLLDREVKEGGEIVFIPPISGG